MAGTVRSAACGLRWGSGREAVVASGSMAGDEEAAEKPQPDDAPRRKWLRRGRRKGPGRGRGGRGGGAGVREPRRPRPGSDADAVEVEAEDNDD